MKYFSLIIFVATVSLLSCKKTNDTKEEATIQNTTIDINSCKVFSANKNFKICYDSLINENRCPIDAVCVWQGIAIVKLSLTQNNSSVSFKLSTIGGNYFPPIDTTINGINIKLIDVLPYPKLSGNNTEIKKVILVVQ